MSIQSQINDFLLTGQFTNNIDEFGNVNLYISSSNANEQYIANDGRHYYTIWYDTNDTNYYVDPTGTSRIANIRVDGGRYYIHYKSY